ncbi:hypothetical protein SKAU_G00333940 [Synaphobranchus kaupii]|uniref:DH domain-containing protein n=1 Tax=Synaphobranchus kaupii TaxID=118154 RepID=A0A9Q1ELP0_SYNKA|nr:hypothetical protein SKAU_G00333940 [Synaphobranchus kaupii]
MLILLIITHQPRLRKRLPACPVSYPEVLSSLADLPLPVPGELLALATPAWVFLEEEKTDLFTGGDFCRVVIMKPEEAQLISEISELQSVVSEIKVGFSSALLELSHIQQEDARLREDLEHTKQHCDQEALQLRVLVHSLKTDLQEVRHQICQLHKDQQKPQQADGGEGSGSTQTQRNTGKESPVSEPCSAAVFRSCAHQACGGPQCDSAAPPPTQPASLLLHCYLQGLRAGLCPITENPVTSQASARLSGPSPFPVTPCTTNILHDSCLEGKRRQVVSDLFHSEQEYLSTLFQLYDKYKILSALPKNHGTCQMLVDYLEQVSQHSLLFRNALEDRLHSKHWQGLVGDVFARLTCQNEGTFMGIYLGYVRILPMVLSNFHQSNGIIHTPQGSLQEREELQQVSQLLAPVSRIHSYLTHMQDLLQWTSRDHPDHYLLQASKKTLRNFLSQCHVILEQGGLQGDRGKAGCSSPAPPLCTLSPACHHSTGNKGLTPREHCEPASATNRSEVDINSHSANGFPALNHPGSRCPNLQGSVRKSHGQDRVPNPFSAPHHLEGAGCHGNANLLWGATDPGGEKKGRSLARAPPLTARPRDPGSHDAKGSLEDCDTDLDDLGDTSVFDYSSVTSCSPDGTLEMREQDPEEGRVTDEKDEDEEEEEENSQVPVLLKPSGGDTQPVQRLVPKVPPQPPPGKPRTPYTGQPTPGPECTKGNGRETPSREYKMAHGTIANPGGPSGPRVPPVKGRLRSVLGVALFRARRSSPQWHSAATYRLTCALQAEHAYYFTSSSSKLQCQH